MSLSLTLALWLVAGCGEEGSGTAGMPIHLEDRIYLATIEGAWFDASVVAPMRWTFDHGPAGWKVLPNLVAGGKPAEVGSTDNGLRVRLTKDSLAPAVPTDPLDGGIYVDVEEWDVDDWSHVEIEARVSGSMTYVGIGYNLRETPGEAPMDQWPLVFWGSGTDLASDGEVHTFRSRTTGEGGR